MQTTASAIKRILVIRFSSAGDIILTSPVIRSLHRTLPDWEIHVLTLNEFAPLFSFSPHVCKVHSIDRSLNAGGLREYRNHLLAAHGKFDVVLDLHASLRSRIVRHGLGRQLLTIRKPTIRKKLLVWFGWNLLQPVRQIPLLYLDAARPLGVQDDGTGLELFAGDSVSPLKPDCERPTWVLAPGARHNTKAWPPAKWGELARTLARSGDRVVLLGGPSEVDVCNRVMLESGVAHAIVNLAGSTTLLQAAVTMDVATGVVANDSALAHVAIARGRPTVVIFGSTVLDFGFGPFRGRSIVVERPDVSCRPCSAIGRESCPRGHFNCMELIDVERVHAALIEVTRE